MRGPRRGSQAGDRRIARKLAKTEAATFGGYEGKSIMERLEEEMLRACHQYLTLPEPPEDEEHTMAEWAKVEGERAREKGVARGKIRGLAISLSYMGQQTYSGGKGRVVKEIEKTFIARAKAEIPPY